MTDRMTFPDLDEVVQALSDYERRFVLDEYRPGLPYYLSRLDRLMLSGARVLDAGCGVGQWSIALSQRFEEVEAIDQNAGRLDVFQQISDRVGAANIRMRQGSIERLPYEDGSFDAVLCYGVIMFCDVQQVLAEFYRVTRPGGRVYLCLNGDGWSRYLIEDRGRSDPQARAAGLRTLYSTYWHRAVAQGVLQSLKEKQNLVSALITRPVSALVVAALQSARRLGWKRPAREAAGFLLTHSRGGTELRDAVRSHCGDECSGTLLDDVWELLSGVRSQLPAEVARAYLPNEFGPLAEAAGFADFQWSVEGGLVCDWVQTAPTPKYIGTFDNVAAVWEALLVKPDRNLVPFVSLHLQGARQTRHTRLYQAVSGSPILSNGSRHSYPKQLLERAQAMAAELGGDAYLRALARLLTEGVEGEEQAARRIIYFVQRALFRDPVSQPITEVGDLPDPLTILLCARGRCGHAAALVVNLLGHIGLEARILTLPTHIATEANVAGRWVVVDADAFKNGVIPVNRQGQMLALDEIRQNPYQLDRFPPTGWFVQPNSAFVRDVWGRKVAGYVDALTPDQRGYVSGYYVPGAKGSPPSLPVVVRFDTKGDRFHLEWTPSTCRTDRLLGYRIAVGSTSRGWSYDNPGDEDEILRPIHGDVVSTETFKTSFEGDVPSNVPQLFTSVTAYSSRIEKESETYFWPSEEASTCLSQE
jgi:ubiquinone/menaquinone biosynthesis C-methylase UbiE